MRVFLLLLYLLISPLFYYAQPDSTISEFADSLLVTNINENNCEGISAGVTINGKTIWKGGEGYSMDSIAFDDKTLTRIASIVKPMTAIAIMQLAEKNKINLDIEIQTYVPDFPIKEEGVITTRQLLMHRAGIPSYAGMKEINNQIEYASISDAVAIFENRDLVSIPGKEYHYSSYGYDVLGLIIENVSGMTYEAYMQKNIWDKAGMKNTGIEVYGKDYPNKSLLYKKNKDGSLNAVEATNLSDRIPGGGVYSTVSDLLKFGNAILKSHFIKRSTFQLMLITPGGDEDGTNYGLGWYIYSEEKDPNLLFGHSGSQLGASAIFFISLKENKVIAALSNTSDSGISVKNTALELYLKTNIPITE